MRSIKGKDTKPEILVRKEIHAKGFRYLLHSKSLPGKPDIVLPKYKAVIEIDGCFWHGHGCRSLQPSTNQMFWQTKIEGNKKRDSSNREQLACLGWRICRVWECALRGKGRLGVEVVANLIEHWLKSNSLSIEIKGS